MEEKRLSPLHKIGLCVLATTLLMTTWWLAEINPSEKPLPFQKALPFALFAGIFFVYWFPNLLRLCPSYIRIYEQKIFRLIGNTGTEWKLKDIDLCELASITIDNRVHAVIVIHTNKDK